MVVRPHDGDVDRRVDLDVLGQVKRDVVGAQTRDGEGPMNRDVSLRDGVLILRCFVARSTWSPTSKKHDPPSLLKPGALLVLGPAQRVAAEDVNALPGIDMQLGLVVLHCGLSRVPGQPRLVAVDS